MIDIVIPYYKAQDTIEDLLFTIQEQDYKKISTTVVLDGVNEEDLILLETLQDTYKFRIAGLEENSGASAARNLGATYGEGKYLFFIDADCKLFPGIVREAVEALEEDPTIDFVYGNYRFQNKHDYYSRPFDAELLTTMNYINTMSPMRRSAFEAVGGFIKGQKFFQDWSLFYRMVENGSKGKHIQEFFFSTQLPTEDSISGTQGLTLAEKSAIFRKEHGIKDKELVVTTFGAPLQAEQRAKLLEADYAGPAKNSNLSFFPPNLAFDNWKATYVVGVYNSPIQALSNHFSATVGRPILHFIGRDVHQLLAEHPYLGIQDIKKSFEDTNAAVLVNSQGSKDELDALGISSDLVYTPVYNLEKFKSESALPKKFTVGVYYSDNLNLNYFNVGDPTDTFKGQSNVPLLFEVAKAMPTVNFKFFGGSHREKRGNIEFCGRIPEEEMPEFIKSCSMVVRSTIHDGFPQLPIQFMLSGRSALVSYQGEDLKGAERLSFDLVTDKYAAKQEVISKIYEIRDTGRIPDVSALYEYYKELFDVNVYREKVMSYVKDS
jgi:hypothetical protein